MKAIKLTKGFEALVSDDDYEMLSKFKWCVRVGCSTNYAAKYANGSTILMHRMIMNPPEDMEIDHVDGNGLNNQRENLRICTRQQNMWNVKSHKDSKSKYVGVHYSKERRGWIAKIMHNGVNINVKGCFKTERDAALARDKVIIRYRPDFAKLNILKRK